MQRPMTSKERVLGLLAGGSVDRAPFMPITMMFAADLAGVSYRSYATDHRTLVRAQMLMAETFGVDFVSCISDPGREASDCGAEIAYFEDQPPAILEERALLTDKQSLSKLRVPDPLGGGRMHDRVQAAALFKEQTRGRLLIEGWVEGPCAEAADLRGINSLMMDFYDDPGFVRDLFDFVLGMELAFAKAQVDAGVDIIGVGDAAASLVGPRLYEDVVWEYEKRLVDGIHALGVPVRLHICGNTRKLLGGMGRLGCEIVDLDFPSPVSEGRQQMGPAQVLLGNLNPVRVVRDGTPASIMEALAQCRQEAGERFIVGAGCEIPRGTPAANLRAMAEFAAGLGSK